MPAGNRFIKALQSRDDAIIGLWVAAADPYVASIAGGAGFDWLLIDGEHAPNDVRSILGQLMALNSSPAALVVRPPMGEAWLIKQLLDIGAQTLLIPMVDTADQAREIVRAMKYPPTGIRGMGAGLGRAADFGRDATYATRANDETCLLVQAESRTALENLAEIAAVDGVDGVFIGPADLAADMGESVGSPRVQEAIEKALAAIKDAGKPAGILTFDSKLNHRYIELGARFVAVGSDVTELSGALQALAAEYGRGDQAQGRPGY